MTALAIFFSVRRACDLGAGGWAAWAWTTFWNPPVTEAVLKRTLQDTCVCTAAQCPAPAAVGLSVWQLVVLVLFVGAGAFFLGAVAGAGGLLLWHFHSVATRQVVVPQSVGHRGGAAMPKTLKA